MDSHTTESPSGVPVTETTDGIYQVHQWTVGPLTVCAYRTPITSIKHPQINEQFHNS